MSLSGRLIFRADANITIGRGHVSRCIAIADMVRQDIDILFITLNSNKEYIENIVKDYALDFIENENDIFSMLQKEDILWFDGYHFTEDWKKKIRLSVIKLIETNDIPYPAENVDIILNHTPGLNKEHFQGKLANTKLYLGLDYALLRQKFLKIAKDKVTAPEAKGVFVCFGGADTYNLGQMFVEALLQNNFHDPIYWVTNTLKPETQFDSVDNLRILSNLDEEGMIQYMSMAKTVLIPSSVLSFEAMALRKPIFTCYFVDNQKLIYRGLIENDLATGFGYLENKDEVAQAATVFLDYYQNNKLHLKQIENQKVMLDGKSGERIREILLVNFH